MSDAKDWLEVERDFDAPIDAVWAMWTDPELFKKWYGPNGVTVPAAEMDLRVGGTRKICMEMKSPQNSFQMWFIGVYKEISVPNRLVYTESMCDEKGTLISPQSMGMPDDFPDITEVFVDLTETGAGTHMKLVHIGVKEGTAGAGGWHQAFDKMEKSLSMDR
ncbi:MAG: SRPBCC domain-containing protein [Pseudomonadota bacterium]